MVISPCIDFSPERYRHTNISLVCNSSYMQALGFRKTLFRHNNGYTGAQFCGQVDLRLCYTLVPLEIKHSILKKRLYFSLVYFGQVSSKSIISKYLNCTSIFKSQGYIHMLYIFLRYPVIT